jgi:hypothetical protein
LMMTHQDSSLSPRWIHLQVHDQFSGGEYLVASDLCHLIRSSLPHWLAFWAVGEPSTSFYLTPCSVAVGFKRSIIEYAQKIEDLFAKMEGVRATVLPPNRKPVTRYLSIVWQIVHTLTDVTLSLDSELPDSDKFKLYLETEETRLENNLRGVNYVLDGSDTLALITGSGRIEKVGVFHHTLCHPGPFLIFVRRPSSRCYIYCWDATIISCESWGPRS